ncbi:MAG: hypothetical protein ACD_73C00740G0003 [uncultured bacterium]|nr:MAG: hypothetical protein ACD_73C00740G0003 [uncultured bacterium]
MKIKVTSLQILVILFMGLLSFLSNASDLKIGDSAPDFKLKNQKGEEITLAQFKNKKIVVLYFYPKDETPGCTAEACAFRDSYEIFQKAGAEVIGVSGDDETSHTKFAANHHLPFHLLSDTDNKLRKAFKVASTLGVMPGRVTFVIDKQGNIVHVFSSQMQATKHIEEALEAIKKVGD